MGQPEASNRPVVAFHLTARNPSAEDVEVAFMVAPNLKLDAETRRQPPKGVEGQWVAAADAAACVKACERYAASDAPA